MIRLGTRIDGRRTIEFGRWCLNLHNMLTFVGLLVGAFIIASISISLGAIEMTFGDVLHVIFGGTASENEYFAVFGVRMPRIMLGFMVGCTVAMAGAMLQSLAQNPLADPGLLGLSQGSLIMIMIFIVFLPDLPEAYYPFGALLGGLCVGALLLTLTGKNNSGGIAIVLMGIAVETTLSSISAMLLIHTPPEISYDLGVWLNGSLLFSTWAAVWSYLPWFGLTVLLALWFGKITRALDLGDQKAMTLGEGTHKSKPLLLIGAVLITAASVTAVGPLVFLGVIAPHLAQFLSPSSGTSRLFLSAAMGGAIVVAADVFTRTLAATGYVPIGLTIIMIGAPLFIITLRLRRLNH